jgi:type IV pilus assembly protein PilM
MLDFDALPSKNDEALSVLRFRLRKMVPFEIEHAGLSYQVLVQTKTECKVLAAVIPGPILQEYEAAVRSAGYEPGAVLPSGLAALSVLDSMEAVLIANLTPVALTTSITNGQDLLLYRTLDLPEDPAQRLTEVQRGIAVAAAYYEDKLQFRPQKMSFAGSGGAVDFGSWLNDPEMTVSDLAPLPETGMVTALGDISIAGVAGALAGAS